MKLTLAGCRHPILKEWLVDYVDKTVHFTCMVCYERLIAGEEAVINLARGQRGGKRAADNSGLPRDEPAKPCPHKIEKYPIPKDPKFVRGDYTDALCMNCGVVLRHPEGPGAWEEVIFSGYVIREEP